MSLHETCPHSPWEISLHQNRSWRSPPLQLELGTIWGLHVRVLYIHVYLCTCECVFISISAYIYIHSIYTSIHIHINMYTHTQCVLSWLLSLIFLHCLVCLHGSYMDCIGRESQASAPFFMHSCFRREPRPWCIRTGWETQRQCACYLARRMTPWATLPSQSLEQSQNTKSMAPQRLIGGRECPAKSQLEFCNLLRTCKAVPRRRR